VDLAEVAVHVEDDHLRLGGQHQFLNQAPQEEGLARPGLGQDGRMMGG
jgi:hypothetical protein